ncbi:MAG: DUF1553 domain-containing protein [Pedosphaera sp.]|nr:DUF1553 domain-containing protein [Pedosphaera sp.]
MKTRFQFRLFVTLGSLVIAAGASAVEDPVDFARDIRPLLKAKCASCHGGVKRAGELSFLSREGVVAKGKSGKVAVKPGDAPGSEIMRRITSADLDERMPPSDHGPALPMEEIGLLRRWISQGAPWKQHWAYEKPAAARLPRVQKTAWAQQDLDRFILARLEAENLSPAPEADRLAWLRRVSFDLIGLPPSENESRAFLADASPQAHEKVTDRLLGSPGFGERWASVWLDLARYADTMGYERDPNRSAWPWRDWVIAALNDDLPYNEFLTKQLAGDLLPDPTLGDRLATTFHRNTQGNTECGSDDEEFRIIAVLDRIATTWEGLMATSFRCAQCHSHPYDPFKHEEFYRFAALFNGTRDNDSAEDFPHLAVPEQKAQWPHAEALDRDLRRLRHEIHGAGIALAEKSAWRPLRASSATSDGNATMQSLDRDGVPEVHITGVITLKSFFKLEFPAPGPQFTALRIDALPFDLAKAAVSSELGFVLSHLRMEVVADGKAFKIPLVTAYDDDPDAFYPAEATLQDDLPGWSAYPRMNGPRRVVFVVAEPVKLPPGAVIRLTLQTKAQSTGITSQMVRRSRYAISGDSEWTQLGGSQVSARKQLAALTQQRDAIKSMAVPVMIEQSAASRRETHLFRRGNFLDPGQRVTPGVPEVLGGDEVRDRLELARWMTSPGHPLTARTAVNRLWEQLFGRGLVESVEDFGSAGQLPSHPELLDWLAVQFSTTLGWSQKKLLRELVLSATYRQDATVTPPLLARDPGNRLLARGPRTRLSAEMVRDQSLAVSGLLSAKVGGPPVMPQQPEGIWRTVYNGGKWITSSGEDKHRRAIYTFIRRTSGYPSFLTFDAPSREVCAVRRIVTSTPLQALVTLNDPVYIEAATALANRMTTGDTRLERRLAYGFELATGRPAPREALTPLLALHTQAMESYKRHPKEAEALAGPPDKAALAVVANALLNLDAVLTK